MFWFFFTSSNWCFFQVGPNDLVTSRCCLALSFKTWWLWVGSVAEEAGQCVFYQGPIKAWQATGAVWWSGRVGRCWPMKFSLLLQLGLKSKPPCLCGWVKAAGRFAGCWCCRWSARITHSLIRHDSKRARRFFSPIFSCSLKADLLRTDNSAHIWCFV